MYVNQLRFVFKSKKPSTIRSKTTDKKERRRREKESEFEIV